MILLLDAGNSRIKWEVRDAGVRLARGVRQTSDVAGLAAELSWFPLHHALLSCVANVAVREELNTLLAAHEAQLAWVTAAASAHGVENGYQPPDSLGSDRYAALVAAARRGLGACLVVTVGTALTVDALLSDGRFLGGVIAPGPDLMRAALFNGTAGVREMSGALSDFPVDTGAAVGNGIALAQVGVVAGMRQRLARMTGDTVTVLLSGGAREVLVKRLEPPLVEADDLVLEGLAWIARDMEWDV